MTILLAIQGMGAEAWQQQLEKFKSRYPVVIWPCEEPLESVKYALAWHSPPGLLAKCPNLEVIFSLGAGVDHLISDPNLPDIPIVRIVDPNLTMRMTEYVVFHVLLHHRKFHAYDQQQRQKKWQLIYQPGANEVRVGVMGMGSLGSDAACKLRDLGFQVAGWSNSPKSFAGIKSFAGPEQLTPFLNRTDILVVLLPHTPATEGILNSKLLASLARDGVLDGPVLINAGRGKLQVEADILAALDNNILHAASLDVFEKEPLALDSPLWSHERVTVTPHNASESDNRALSKYILDQIERYEAGQGLENIIDNAKGY
jgi:glyoxylate/hydroxypyruvate reductase